MIRARVDLPFHDRGRGHFVVPAGTEIVRELDVPKAIAEAAARILEREGRRMIACRIEGRVRLVPAEDLQRVPTPSAS